MNFRTIRIIVTLCLVAATAIQPVHGFAVLGSAPTLTADSGRACGAETQTATCGCCDVDASSGVCCCCGPKDSAAPERSVGRSRLVAADQIVDVKAPAEVRCDCSVVPQPMDRPQQRDRLIREWIVRIAVPDFFSVAKLDFDAPSLRSIETVPMRQDDFFQRFLCVWRI